MIRVLVADDHPIVREGLKRVIAGAPDMVLAGEAECGEEVLSFLEKESVDVVVLDLHMPGPTCLSIMETLASTYPGAHAVIVTAQDEKTYAARMLEAGAYAFLPKESAPGELLQAVRWASQGRRYITPSVGERLAEALRGEEGPAHRRLSPREFEVLRLTAKGASTKRIAALLGISPKTVSTYRARVREKLGFASQAELLRYALGEGLDRD
ncbi:MAG: response regulator [Gemmatimonadota bacterium]